MKYRPTPNFVAAMIGAAMAIACILALVYANA